MIAPQEGHGAIVSVPMAVTLVLLLACSAAVAAAEAAMLSINKVRLRHLAEQGHRGAQLTFKLLAQLDRVIGTILVANTLVNIMISTLGSWIIISLLGPERGLVVATVVITCVILLVGEVAPKMFAATHPEMVAFVLAWPLRVLMVALYPFAVFFTWAGRMLLRLLRIPTKRRSPLVTEEEIKVMIQMGREAGVLAEGELRLLHRIFEFSDSVVSQVMVSREQIAGIDLAAKPDDILDVLVEEGHSRVPVYRGTLDDVVGVIYARDLLAMARHGGLFVLDDLIRPIASVPGTMRVAELLSDFQRTKTQIAIVTDAKAQTIGLVTIEDLLEEIVGEIHEEIPEKS